MNGYKNIFDNSIVKFNNFLQNGNITQLLNNFRFCHDIYGFIDNGDKPTDEQAVKISKSINEDLYQQYYKHITNKKIIGYGNYSPTFGNFSQLESRHIMMSIILFSNIKDNITNILEIGGGYGGWLHLNNEIQNFKKWYILDLLHLNILQEWYLSSQNISRDKYELYSNENYGQLLNIKLDLVIGSHSLSEFSIEIFNDYFEKLVKNIKYFFYAYHKYLPNINLINNKKDIIEKHFNLVIMVDSENDNVANCLYVNKNNSL
jgi:hypothetical protein